MLRRALHAVGYAIAPLLFFGADTPRSVARRLRRAYRLVGVKIVETPRVDDAERTVFLCPYRNLGATRLGEKRLCHDVLDRVDDGYATYLRRHKAIDYRRPRGCEELAFRETSAYCFSEVTRGDGHDLE